VLKSQERATKRFSGLVGILRHFRVFSTPNRILRSEFYQRPFHLPLPIMLGDVSARFQRVMPKANFETRIKLVNLLVNSVTLLTNKAKVKEIVPIDNPDALITTRANLPFFDSPKFSLLVE
jgi:hypothetical protein